MVPRPRLTGPTPDQLRVPAARLWSSVTVTAWLHGYAPRARYLVRRGGAGLAAALAQTSVPDG